MNQILMLKTFLRAVVVTVLFVLFTLVFLQHTLITLCVLIAFWFILMLQLDPPADWDK